MKILITCFKLDLSGSSTFTLTLCEELIKRGEEVSIFTVFCDELSSEFEKIGVSIYLNADDVKKKVFDIIIAQHSILALLARYLKPKIPMIFISHGILPELERIPSVDVNIQYFLAISEECQNKIKNAGIPQHRIHIVRNLINTERFKPLRKISSRPKTALFISNHKSEIAYQNIKNACQKLNIKLIRAGNDNKTSKIEKEINKADLVFSLGRGALESMSCGRAVIIYDYNGGDGMITSDNFEEIKKNNFSGRRYKINFDVNGLVKEIIKYDAKMALINRKLVIADFSVSSETDKIQKICKKAKTEFYEKNLPIPGAELIFCLKQIAFCNQENQILKNRKIFKLINKIKKLN